MRRLAAVLLGVLACVGLTSTLASAQSILTGTTCPNACAVIDAQRYGSIIIQINDQAAGTWTAQFEMSNDGTNYKSLSGTSSDGSTTASTTGSSSVFIVPGGSRSVRVRLSAYSSGAPTVTLSGSPASPPANVSATVSGSNPAAGATGSAVPSQASYTGINIAGNNTGVTGFSLGTARAAATAIVDGSGNQITSFGGGTQYTNGSAQATPTGTAAFGWDGTNVRNLSTNSSGQLNVIFPSAQPVSGTVTANIGTSGSLALDASVTGLQVSQGSTTAGQKGAITFGAVTTAAPTYTTAQTSPLSLTTAGALRVDGSAVTQPVSGTVTANAGTGNFTVVQATGTNLHTVCDSGCSGSTAPADEAAFTYGTTSQTPIGGVYNTAITALTSGQMGAMALTPSRSLHVSFYDPTGAQLLPNAAALADATANPTTSGVASYNMCFNGTTWDRCKSATLGNGTNGNAQLVTIASDSTGVVGLNAGTNIVGKVGIDQTTPGTTNAVSRADSLHLTATSYTAAAYVAGSSTTDNAVLPGNATNTVLVTQVIVSCTQTTAGTIHLSLLKRSSADTSGTSAGMTVVPDDSGYAAGVSAPLTYTGTGPTAGTSVGSVDEALIGCNATSTAGPNDVYVLNLKDKPIVLRGTAQQLAINTNGAITGGNLAIKFKWIETTSIVP